MENRAKATQSPEAPRRFLFDQSFDTAPRRPKKRKPEEEKPPEPTFSQAELEAARQEGYAEGHAAGCEETRGAIEAEIAQLVAAIGTQLPALAEAQAAANARLLHDGARLAAAVTRKILPAYTARHGMDQVNALIAECLQTLIDQPKITVRVGQPYADAVREHLDAAAAESAFDGRFQVEPDGSLGASDCRILWQGGGLERREAEIWSQIEAATKRFLAELEGGDGERETDDDRQPPALSATQEENGADPGPTDDDENPAAAEAPAGVPDPLEDR